MALKFNVYYRTELSAPWTLANTTPIDYDALGNEYTVEDLQPNTRYYLAIVAGVEESGTFIPYIGQAIGPTNNAIVDIDGAQLQTVQTSTRVNAQANAVLGNILTVI